MQQMVLIFPRELVLSTYMKELIDDHNVEYKEVSELEGAMGELDILYMTRVQRERFFNEEDYIRIVTHSELYLRRISCLYTALVRLTFEGIVRLGRQPYSQCHSRHNHKNSRNQYY